MPAYVIDTDIASDILQGRPDAVRVFAAVQRSPSNRIYFSRVTQAELLSTPGLTPDQVEDIDRLMASADAVLDIDDQIARVAGDLRQTNNSGHPPQRCPSCGRRLGGRLKLPDALVVATAITENAVLVTGNIKDYAHLVQQGRLIIVNPRSISQRKLGASQ